MDVEPIYCAEQIVVPVDLADILRAYTKEVIRRQPENLVEFSAKYFQNLSNVASGVKEAVAPTRDQLKKFYDRCGGVLELTPEQVHALASQFGIGKSIVAKVLIVGRFEEGVPVNVDRFLFLLLVMSCDSFAAVVRHLFDVFGRTLEADRFLQLISNLAPDMDPDITSQFLMDLEQQLEGLSQSGVQGINYLDAIALPVIKSKL